MTVYRILLTVYQETIENTILIDYKSLEVKNSKLLFFLKGGGIQCIFAVLVYFGDFFQEDKVRKNNVKQVILW